jgi:hypothetical protein
MIALLLAAPLALGAEQGFEISPRLGTGLIHIDRGFTLKNTEEDVHTAGAGVTLAYVTPINLLVEGGYSSQGNWDWFGSDDEFRFSEYTAALGYRFETPHGFRLVPKVGRTHWELFSKDSAFHRPDFTQTLKDDDYFWEFTLQKQLGRSVALGVTYKKNHYDFGSVRVVSFTASFAL